MASANHELNAVLPRGVLSIRSKVKLWYGVRLPYRGYNSHVPAQRQRCRCEGRCHLPTLRPGARQSPAVAPMTKSAHILHSNPPSQMIQSAGNLASQSS